MKTYKILVTETEYVAYYVDATSEQEAQQIWADGGYEGDKRIVEDSRCDITGVEEEIAQ
jgi:hypothetical protein